MKGDAFITGATGLIGGEVAIRVAATGRRVWCLVRAKSFTEAASRLEKRFLASDTNCDWSRVVALPGDILVKNLGLELNALEHLREVCGQVIHCAGETSFAPGNRCQEINVIGTRNVIEVCSRLGSKLFHVSSAAVGLEHGGARDRWGSRAEPVFEKEDERLLDHGDFGKWPIREDDGWHGYANDYIKSKRRCEEIVLASAIDPVILRPSIVMSEGVAAREFARSILWVFPLIRKLGVLPISGRELIDAVTVRFVAESITRMLDRPLKHSVYHISAGPNGSISWKELFDNLTAKGHDYSSVRFAPRMDWKGFGRCNRRIDQLKRAIDYYLPFMRAGAVYDRGRLEKCLSEDLPECSKGTDYCAALLDLVTEREALSEAARP